MQEGTVDGSRAELSVEADVPDEGPREGGRAAHGRAAPRALPPVRLRVLRLLARGAPGAGGSAGPPGRPLRAGGGARCLTTRTTCSTSSPTWRTTPSPWRRCWAGTATRAGAPTATALGFATEGRMNVACLAVSGIIGRGGSPDAESRRVLLEARRWDLRGEVADLAEHGYPADEERTTAQGRPDRDWRRLPPAHRLVRDFRWTHRVCRTPRVTGQMAHERAMNLFRSRDARGTRSLWVTRLSDERRSQVDWVKSWGD